MDHGPGRGHLHLGPAGGKLIPASGSARGPSWLARPFYDLAPPGPNARCTVIIPAPYEGTVSYGRGTAQGPRAVLRASWEVEHYDRELGQEMSPALSSLPPLRLPKDPARAIARVEQAAAKILDHGRRPLLLGGEHSLSLGAIRAVARRHPKITVLHLDAHGDRRDQYDGTPFSHACVMRRVTELGLPVVSVGLRSLCQEEHDTIRRYRQKVFWAAEIKRDPGWVKAVIRSLGRELYLTLDVDVLDPAEMPATGAPEPGGLSWSDLLDLIRGLAASQKKILGLDLVELAPIPGLHAPDFLCARLLFFLLARLRP
jgi:agmatinase